VNEADLLLHVIHASHPVGWILLRHALLVAMREGTQIAEIRLPAEDGKL
jgi:hypothetical protein